MAENERCISRVVSGEGILAKSVDHHEWRFLRTDVVGGKPISYNVFYCVFCLETKKVEQVKGQWASD
ncbi:hypothetical protein LCGC14_1427900 [marine sediment metagenome]|uniref:Uncharacterized protein n=1 Tax=marine sediment metagenome TaxID=412755 RepID=A0A0F9MR55_9ZZZZ